MTLIEPNLHPILVHFTYALLTTGAISTLIVSLTSSGGWRDTLGHAADWMIAFGIIAAVLTVGAGFQAYYTVAHDGPAHEAMTTHRNWALPTTVALALLAGWRWRKRREKPSRLFAFVFVLAALSLTVTAWWGGRLVYGHGLGVSSLPQTIGEGHQHEHGSMEGDDHHAAPPETETMQPHNQDDAHDHGGHEH